MPGLAAAALALALTSSLQAPQLPMPPMQDLAVVAPPSDLDAQAWMLYSVDAGADIWSQDPDRRWAPASITKVMTAILVVEEADLSAVVTVSEQAGNTAIGFPGQPEILPGEQWTVLELLEFLLVKSGNDVAAALAEHVSGSEADFVARMNERAAEIGMEATTFRNPHGLDAEGHLSTARDLIRLGEAALEHPRLLATTALYAVTFERPDRAPVFIDNTNKLIGRFPGVYGLKTGDTLAAGTVLLTYLDTGSQQFLGVVLGSRDHLGASRDLLAYALETRGPADYFLAPLSGSEAEAALPEWMAPRLAAVGDLPDGLESLTSRYATPLSARIVAGLRDLLPGLLGGGT